MDSNILVALISVAGGVVVALIGAFRERIAEGLSSTNRKLSRFWLGTSADLQVPGHLVYKDPLSYELSLEIIQIGRAIWGTCHLKARGESGAESSFVQTWRGALVTENFVRFTCRVKKPGVVHWATVMLNLNDEGSKMTGFFFTNHIYQAGFAFGWVELCAK